MLLARRNPRRRALGREELGEKQNDSGDDQSACHVLHAWATGWSKMSGKLVGPPPCGYSVERTRSELSVLEDLPGWDDVSAVREGRVWIVDGPAYFNRPGPRVVDGAEQIAALLAGGIAGV